MMGYEFLIRVGWRALPYVLVLGLAWGIYHQGQLAERSATELKQAKADIEVLHEVARRNAFAASAAADDAKARAATEIELTRKVEDYEEVLKARGDTARCLLDDVDIGGVRSLAPARAAKPAPLKR